jgi:hypothetical protein
VVRFLSDIQILIHATNEPLLCKNISFILGTFLQILFCFNGNINPIIIVLEIDGCIYFVENYKNEQWILHIVICMILSE